MPALNTIMTVHAKNSPSCKGVNPRPSIKTRGSAENIANSAPRIRLTVAAGMTKRRSVESDLAFGDRQRIERGARDVVSFAEYQVICDRGDGGEDCDEGKR